MWLPASEEWTGGVAVHRVWHSVKADGGLLSLGRINRLKSMLIRIGGKGSGRVRRG